MASVNKFQILGNLTEDPTLRATGSGKSVCNLNVATNKSYKDQSGKLIESVAFHRITVWGPQAEACGKHLVKGQQVFVEGELAYETFEKEGQKVYKTVLNAREVIFLARPGGKSEGKSAPYAGNKAKPAAQSQDDNDFGGSNDDAGDLPF